MYFIDLNQEYRGWKLLGSKLKQIYFHIRQNKGQELHYIYNGEIIQTVEHNESETRPQIITNLEVVKHLKWMGKLEKNANKVGLWTATWKGEILNGVGGHYSLEGKKQGLWKETINNFYDFARVYEFGEYVNDLKQGIWKYMYENKQLGGGQYNQQGEKNGKWIVLSDVFSDTSQITYNGVYKNGNKVGRWDIMFRQNCDQRFENIGGGLYDEHSSNKSGKWTELSDGFSDYFQVVQVGEYKNGHKVGRWDILSRQNQKQKFLINIGGGSYQEGSSIKIGKWVELHDAINNDMQITYNGDYKNGKKVGRWDAYFWFNWDQKFQLIGGGLYDDKTSIKLGRWTELSDRFSKYSQVINIGEYKDGKKIGKWDTLFMDVYHYSKYEEIGGGLYNDEGSIKIGKWIELSDAFTDKQQITYIGEYNNGKKIGRWNINFQGGCLQTQSSKQQYSGGGAYDEESQLKIGKWIDLTDNFTSHSIVTYNGEYKYGKKVGRWDILSQKNNQNEYIQIGGGLYDEKGSIKIGRWTELSDRFSDYSQVIYIGDYNNGNKVGKWNIEYRRIQDEPFEAIGGGEYHQESLIKIGKWIELSDGFCRSSQVTFSGEYKNGNKFGRWNPQYRDLQELTFQTIGGGQYEEASQTKIGRWIELSEGFRQEYQVVYNGEYKQGDKSGQWIVMERDYQKMEKGFIKVKKISYDH
ncbi:unnamed protein product [Paramecium octaurelia]|uniref:Uncharacterized protein n=1 Tax=Paramecium octaurelia TaxID=43137 RepID=A0A8S1TYV7_PAROT|nr:unnamed protein product [Paramecium octaurelia]